MNPPPSLGQTLSPPVHTSRQQSYMLCNYSSSRFRRNNVDFDDEEKAPERFVVSRGSCGRFLFPSAYNDSTSSFGLCGDSALSSSLPSTNFDARPSLSSFSSSFASFPLLALLPPLLSSLPLCISTVVVPAVARCPSIFPILVSGSPASGKDERLGTEGGRSAGSLSTRRLLRFHGCPSKDHTALLEHRLTLVSFSLSSFVYPVLN